MYDLAPTLPYIVPLNFILHSTLNHGRPARSPYDRVLPANNSPIKEVMDQYFAALIRQAFLEVAILAGLDEPGNKSFSLMHVFIYFHLKLHLQIGKPRITDDHKSVVHEVIHWMFGTDLGFRNKGITPSLAQLKDENEL